MRNEVWPDRARNAVTIGLLLGCLSAIGPARAAEPSPGSTWVPETTTTLPSSATSWDYITFDPATGHLFIARRADGLTVWNTATNKAVTTIENSKGANGVVLVPSAGRGYTAMTDGTVLSFDLATLKAIDRIKVDDGDLNQGFYDKATNRVHMVVGTRPQKSTWISLDATTGKILGRTEFDSRKMDDPATDGNGTIYAPMRDRNVLLKLTSADLQIQATWTLGACVQPVSIEYDHAVNRILIACRGDKPVFTVLDPTDGRIVATIPIGRGVDGMAHDEKRHLVATANGGDATISVIQQEGPDTYRLVETISTRPMARVLALDPAAQRLFTVVASHAQPAATADGKVPAPVFHPDSFTVMTYTPPKP